MSLETVKNEFTLDRIVKASASLDLDKMMSYQSHWMSELPNHEKVSKSAAFLANAGLIPDSPDEETLSKVAKVVELAGDRLRVFGDILSMDEFFVSVDQLVYDEKEFQKRIVKPDEAINLLRGIRGVLSSVQPFTADAMHQAVSKYVDSKQVKFGQVAPALRLSITGKTKGADLFPTLEFLGRDECVSRIDRAIGTAESQRIS